MTTPRWLPTSVVSLTTLAFVAGALGLFDLRTGQGAAGQEPNSGPQQDKVQKPAPPANQEPQEATFVFNFRNAPWSQVLERFSELAELSLVMEASPPGTFSYFDEKPYTVTQALDLINRVLIAKGFVLVRNQNFLILLPTDKPIPPNLIPQIDADDLGKRADNELVTLVIPLQYATPDSIVTDIRPLLSSFGQTVTLPRSKRMLVTDLVVNLKKLHKQAVDLDDASKPAPPQPTPPPKVEKSLTLENLEAATVAPALSKVFSGSAVIEALGNKVLVIQATADTHEKLAQLVTAIDLPPTSGESLEEAIYPLKHLSASTLYSSLQTLFPSSTRKSSFSYDSGNNAVIASAPRSVQQAVERLIQQLDLPAAARVVEKTYVPKHVPLDPLLSTLQTLYAGGPTRITTDARRRAIIVVAPPEIDGKIAAMIQQLDQPLDPQSAPSERIYKLKHATASAVATTVQTLFPAGVADVRASYDAANNLLIVAANEAVHVRVEKLLAEIDRPAGPAIEERVYVPKHVAAATLVGTLQSLYGTTSSTRMTADPTGQSIIVAAPAEMQKKVEAMLGQLDKAEDADRAGASRIYKLEYATASYLVAPLQTLFPATTTRATFSYDANNNVVIVFAPDTVHARIAEAIRQMDQPPATARRIEKVHSLKAADPQSALSSLQTLFSGQGSFFLDAANRAIIASAPEPVQTKIAAVIEQLEKTDDPKQAATSRIYKLEYATASYLVSPLQTLFPAATTRATFSYDANNNVVIAFAPDAVHARITETIRQMDQPPATARRIDKVHAIKNADPQSVLTALQTLYSGQGSFVVDATNRAIIASASESVQEKIATVIAQLDRPTAAPAGVAQRVYRLRFATPDSLATAFQSLYQGRRDVRILSDSANRSLVVVAPADVQAAVAAMVQDADQDTQGSGVVERVYRPKHIGAASLLQTLTSLYAPADAAAARATQPQVRLSLDPAGQAVLAVAPAAIQSRIEATIELLDQPGDPATRGVVKTYVFRHTTRETVSAALRAAYSQDGRVQVVPGVNPGVIVVIASEAEQANVGKLIHDLDQSPAEDQRSVAVIHLSEVDPFTAASTIRSMFSALPTAQMPFVETQIDPNRLVVRALPDQLVEIRRLLVELGEDPSIAEPGGGRGRTVRAIRVTRGSPGALATAIERLWPRLRRNPLRVVVPSALAPSLSAPGKMSEPPARPEPKKDNGAGKAKDQQPQPSAELPGDPNKPVVLTATSTRVIAASDDSEALTVVEQLARSLLELPSDEQGDFTVFRLVNSDATTLAQTINNAFNGPEPPAGTTPATRRLRPERVRVVVNAQTNTLLVRASPSDLVAVQQMIETLDSADIGLVAGKDVHIVPLRNATASEVAEILREVYRDYIAPGSTGPSGTPGFTARRPRGTSGTAVEVSIGVDRRSNSLIISAPEALFAQMRTLIDGLEEAAAESTRRFRVMPLDRANSSDVREAIDLLLRRDRSPSSKPSSAPGERKSAPPKRPARPSQSSSLRPASREPVTSVSDRGRSSTPVATIRVALGKLEVAEQGQMPGATRNRPQSVSANRAAKNTNREPVLLAGFVEEPPQDELAIDQLSDRAQVDSLPDLNVLLLRGTEQDLEILGEIVEQIEKLATDRQLTFRIVPLEHVKANRFADLVDDLYTGMVNARGSVSRATQQTRVIPLAKPNAILLAAPRNDIDQLVGLIADLDQPVSPATQYRTFRLVHAAANEMSRVVRQFFSGRGADGELSVEIVVTADPRSNSLFVLAGPRDMAEVERLVADLDTPTTASVNQMRVFALQNTLASELVTVLNQAISGSATTATAAAAGGTQIRLLRPDGDNGRFVESGILENVRVTANTRSNTLIVSAPPKTLGLIEELIQQLDVAPSAVAEIKVFTLQHSDAQRMVQTLQSLFSQVQGSGGEVTLAGVPAGQTGMQQPQPTFSVDERTNSLLVSGSRSQLQVIEAIIIRLDGSDVQERSTTVYRLKNATATAVADAVGQFLQRQLLRQLQQVGIEAPTQLLERDVVVVPEPITNSLLISAAPRYFPEVQKLIEQLDEAPPQVVIQVLVAEVTLTDDEEFGIELGIQDSVLFRRGIFPGTATLAPPSTPTGVTINTTQPPGVPGFNFNNQPLGNNPTVGAGSLGGQGLANFGVGRTGSKGFGGMVLSASSENISLLLRALKAQSRINVLSRPQIMTTDNQEAFIQIGQKVPIITNSVITSQGTVINPVTFQDVGIILHVTPKINPDGTVIMRVDPEISSLSQSTVAISTGTFAPVIDTIRAETTVSAQTGQTVIIGGLITSSRFKERRKVPYLGDIPILEWAFRFDQKNDRKRELLILLTPHVVRTVAEAERIKQLEATRMDWCLPEVEEVHGPISELPATSTDSPTADESGTLIDSERLRPAEVPSTPDSTGATQEGESNRRRRLWPFERSKR